MRNDQRNQRSPFQVSNPAFKESAYLDRAAAGEAPATAAGAVGKTGILLSIVIAMGVIGWTFGTAPVALAAIVGALALAFWIAFRPQQAKVLSICYAVVQGFGVGYFSRLINASIAQSENAKALMFRGAIPVALGGTLIVTAVMLVLYRTKVIRVTETFKAVIIGATIAVGITYLITFFGGMLFPALRTLAIYQPTGIGIAFSVFVIALAAMNLILDFHWIEQAEENRCPKYMEWYTGWGLTVTIIWLYIEILRLLSKLANRR